MDEATAHIDSKTEIKIQAALNKLLTNRTSVIIAHRLSTIRDANQIAVLDHGNIIELGTHKKLIETNGKYAQMYKTSDSLAA
jgi:ATP-binding cassette subfamily B protein